MSLNIEVQKRNNEKTGDYRIVNGSNKVYELEEIQEIKDAIQEHIFYIGLDKVNHLRNIQLLGIGNSSFVSVDIKLLVRTAILNADDKVVLVHNHPSDSLKASKEDIKFTNIVKKLLEAFGIELTDHVIVAQSGYISMGCENLIDMEYSDERINNMNMVLLYDENNKLKFENNILKEKLKGITQEKIEGKSEDEERIML